MDRKAYFEQGLKDRLDFLSKKGIEALKIDKDTIIKKLRANISAVINRLKAIAANEKRTEELATMKAEKAMAPPEKAEEIKEEVPKEAPAKAKGKKKKKEETAEEPQPQ